jgi:hypothetical protein
MIEWQDKVERATLRCVASDRPISPGDEMVSVLSLVDGHFKRQDYHVDAWNDDLATSSVSWWRHRRPQAKGGDDKAKIVGPAALRHMFDDLKDRYDRPSQCFAYLLALLLMRRKKLHYLSVEINDDGSSYLLIEDKKLSTVFRIREPQMTESEQTRVEADLEQIFTGTTA